MRINSMQSNKQLKNGSNEKKKRKYNSTMIAVLKLTAYVAVR